MFFLNEANTLHDGDLPLTLDEAVLLSVDIAITASNYLSETLEDDFRSNVLNESTEEGFLSKVFNRIKSVFNSIVNALRKIVKAFLNFVRKLLGRKANDTGIQIVDKAAPAILNAADFISAILNGIVSMHEVLDDVKKEGQIDSIIQNAVSLIEAGKVNFNNAFTTAQNIIVEGKKAGNLVPIDDKELKDLETIIGNIGTRIDTVATSVNNAIDRRTQAAVVMNRNRSKSIKSRGAVENSIARALHSIVGYFSDISHDFTKCNALLPAAITRPTTIKGA